MFFDYMSLAIAIAALLLIYILSWFQDEFNKHAVATASVPVPPVHQFEAVTINQESFEISCKEVLKDNLYQLIADDGATITVSCFHRFLPEANIPYFMVEGYGVTGRALVDALLMGEYELRFTPRCRYVKVPGLDTLQYTTTGLLRLKLIKKENKNG